MRIEEVIGKRIAAIREEQDMTQAGLGELLGKLLGRQWSRQSVSSAEKGRRSFAAPDLVAFASALNVTVDRLLIPSADVDTVTLSEGHSVPAWLLSNPPGDEGALAAPSAHVRELKAVLKEIGLLLERSDRAVDEINTSLALYERMLTPRDSGTDQPEGDQQ